MEQQPPKKEKCTCCICINTKKDQINDKDRIYIVTGNIGMNPLLSPCTIIPL